jgi:hypothetical protein
MNFKFNFLIILAVILGLAIPLIYRHQKISALNQAFIPKQDLYQRNLPADWLVGIVTDIGPSAQVETRYGTEFKDLTVGTTISLGEDIKTGSNNNSLIIVNFPDLIKLKLSSNTRLNFTNTSPQNFLISLNRGGDLTFTTLLDNGSFSITSLHLLSQFTGATGSIVVNDNLITIKLTKGSVKLGYNNTDLKTQITDITGPKKIIFNDTIRTLKLKKL